MLEQKTEVGARLSPPPVLHIFCDVNQKCRVFSLPHRRLIQDEADGFALLGGAEPVPVALAASVGELLAGAGGAVVGPLLEPAQARTDVLYRRKSGRTKLGVPNCQPLFLGVNLIAEIPAEKAKYLHWGKGRLKHQGFCGVS